MKRERQGGYSICLTASAGVLFFLAGCGGKIDSDESAELGTTEAPLKGTPHVVSTETLAPLAGPLYTPAAGQEDLQFYATDLGVTFAHQGQVRILFGDTFVTPQIDPFPNDDTQGSIPFGQCPAGDEVEAWVSSHPPAPGALSWQSAGPPVTFATEPEAPNALSFIHLFRGGVSLDMGPLHGPLAAFSDGDSNAFGLFFRFAEPECRPTAPACDEGLSCDPGLGRCFLINTACVVGAAPGAAGSCPAALPCFPTAQGLCRDTTSSVDDGGDEGRVRSVAAQLEIGVADSARPENYTTRVWNVNKFLNSTARTVRRLSVHTPHGASSDYRPAASANDKDAKVLIWGRPAFAGSRAQNRQAKLYFAYTDMPTIDSNGAPTWSPNYFTGVDHRGVPQFSVNQVDAVPLDLSGGAGDTDESIDVVNQLSVSWVEPLRKWVLAYGGDLDPLLFDLFNPGAVRTPDGAVQVRFADNPWGPWSPAEPLLRAGDPLDPNAAGSQYASGGILFHPGCAGDDCVPSDQLQRGFGLGRLYATNIVDCFTEDRKHGNVDLYFNVSTWNPYQVVLMKARLAR